MQYECEPPIPLGLCLVFSDGSKKFVDNNLDQEQLFDKYRDKLSPNVFKSYCSDRYGYRYLFEDPETFVYKNKIPFEKMEGFN